MMQASAELLGVRISCLSLGELTEQALRAVERTGPSVVFACANPHSLVMAYHDLLFYGALQDATQVVADGIGVTLLAKVVGVPIGPRITGTDYFRGVMHRLVERGGGRVYFCGSTPHVLDRIAQRFARDYPTLTLCGTYAPPFGEWSEAENERILDAINVAEPDVLWIGMTAPKQEKWVYRARRRLRAPVIGSIGAVFDFYAETHPRAPQWMCRAGIEWVYRLLREPARMWRRNFVSTPVFVAQVFWEHGLKQRFNMK